MQAVGLFKSRIDRLFRSKENGLGTFVIRYDSYRNYEDLGISVSICTYSKLTETD